MASNNKDETIDQRNLVPLQNLSISNELMKLVKASKDELELHFQHYYRLLYHKQQQLMSELDAILLSANDLYKKRSELKETQKELEEKIKSNQFHDMKTKMLDLLLAEMSELELAAVRRRW